MKKFLINIAILGVIICIVWYALVFPFFHYYEERAFNNDDLAPFSDINYASNARNIDADLVLIANSRGGAYNLPTLNEELKMKCSGLIIAGYPFDYQYNLMFKPYMEHNKAPKYIIQDVGPWAFFDYVLDKYTIEMLPYIDRPDFAFLKDKCPEKTKYSDLKIVRYAGKALGVYSELKKMNRFTSGNWVTVKSYRKSNLSDKMPLENNPEIIDLFSKYLDECRNLGIKVILVFSPIHMQDGGARFDLKGFEGIIRQVTKGKDVTLLDYHDMFGSDTLYFNDSMHLNSKGSMIFTKELSHCLDSIL